MAGDVELVMSSRKEKSTERRVANLDNDAELIREKDCEPCTNHRCMDSLKAEKQSGL